MEDGLVRTAKKWFELFGKVLILIVVEDGLVHHVERFYKLHRSMGLNPYCSGRWSRTIATFDAKGEFVAS